MKIIMVFFVILLSFPPALFSEIIILKNGKVIEGKIINQTREKIQVELPNKETVVINKKDIRRIQFESITKEPPKPEVKPIIPAQAPPKQEKEIPASPVTLQEKPIPPKITKNNLGVSFGLGTVSLLTPLSALTRYDDISSTLILSGLGSNSGSRILALTPAFPEATSSYEFHIFYETPDITFHFSTGFFPLNSMMKNSTFVRLSQIQENEQIVSQSFSINVPPLNNAQIADSIYLNFWAHIDFEKIYISRGLDMGIRFPFGILFHNYDIKFSTLQYEFSRIGNDSFLFINPKSLTLQTGNNLNLWSGMDILFFIYTYELQLNAHFYIGPYSFYYTNFETRRSSSLIEKKISIDSLETAYLLGIKFLFPLNENVDTFISYQILEKEHLVSNGKINFLILSNVTLDFQLPLRSIVQEETFPSKSSIFHFGITAKTSL